MKPAEKPDFPKFEADLLKIWDKQKTFEQSVKNRQVSPRFSFYDGPPFANGLPHFGHVVALSEKDAVTRYKTMRGYYVPRRNGWDTHGLPVEFEVEKALGINSKRQILDMGIDKFNQAAKASVYKYKTEWEQLMHRLGRWADMEHSYATMDDSYIESVWWVLAQLHKKDLLYRGFRSNPYCPRCATPLSNFEVNQNYKDNVEDPSVFVKFQLTGHDDKSFLVWTTTPWTLPANAALAVDANAEYVEVELLDDGDIWRKGEKLILAKERLGVLDLKKAEYKVVNTKKGQDCVGATYQPLYQLAKVDAKSAAKAWRVYADQSVSLEDGTGILHVAPRYGETDLDLGLREGLPLIESVNGDGHMTDQMADFAGLWFKDADAKIVEDLLAQGRLFAAETAAHTYPFCWRCDTPLIYFALQTWYVQVSRLRDQLVNTNDQIKWVPGHIKQGRFGNWLAEARDWNISRNRFWGAPLPVWVNEADETDYIVVESLDELRRLSGHKSDFDLHRPGIDQVVIQRDGKTYHRVEEVFDCWFESGAMPYAQEHFPFENQKEFKHIFPADFIAEGLDQTRGWFYTLHVLATALYEQPAFKNVVVNGLLLAADGKKLSKRLRNYPDPAEIFEKYGADSLRFFSLSSAVLRGEDVRFSPDAVGEVQRNVLLRLWNVYSFLTTYAGAAEWKPSQVEQPKSQNVLDQWLLARLNQATTEATRQADEYEIARAVRPLRDLIDDLSNWYLRRSRKRFGKNAEAADQRAAFETLHYALVRISQLLAPWTPFLADKLWRELTSGLDLPESVHLSDWPDAGKVDESLIREMNLLREAITVGLAERAQAGLKVRQPLAKATLWDTVDSKLKLTPQLVEITRDELNVKQVEVKRTGDQSKGRATYLRVELDTKLTPELKREGLARDIIRHVQEERKRAGLTVADQIELALEADDPGLKAAIKEHAKMIASETQANIKLKVGADPSVAKVGGAELTICLAKL